MVEDARQRQAESGRPVWSPKSPEHNAPGQVKSN
jgi:hypothetical protein